MLAFYKVLIALCKIVNTVNSITWVKHTRLLARPTLAYFIFNINVLASDSETVGGVYSMKQDKMSNVFTTSTSLQVFSSEKSISFLSDMKLSKDEKK